jgi:heat shock protein HslJ
VSTTDLEDDLRTTFERAAASVPESSGLTERATTGARRAQRRTWIVSGAAAAAVAAIAVAGFGLAGSKNTPTQPPVAGEASASPSMSRHVVTAATVSGTWQAVEMVGAESLAKARPEKPVIELKPDGTWMGSDGCNGLQGTYTIGQDGAFTATIGPQHLVGCDNVPHTGVLQAAKRVSLDGDALRFFDAAGRQLASYARSR